MSDLMEKQISVRPIRDSDLAALVAAAKADNHQVMFPTHVVRKGNEIVGYASIIATPVLNTWLSSKALSPRNSLQLLAVGETLMAQAGVSTVIVPCAGDSPFYPMMERLGYKKIGATVLHGKNL